MHSRIGFEAIKRRGKKTKKKQNNKKKRNPETPLKAVT